MSIEEKSIPEEEKNKPIDSSGNEEIDTAAASVIAREFKEIYHKEALDLPTGVLIDDYSRTEAATLKLRWNEISKETSGKDIRDPYVQQLRNETTLIQFILDERESRQKEKK